MPLQDGGKVYVLFNTDESQSSRSLVVSHAAKRSGVPNGTPLRSVPDYKLTIAKKRPALLWFDGKGTLRAIEAQGEVTIGKRRIVMDETNGILLTLDGEDVRRSRAMVLMPLKPGKVNLMSEAVWRKAVVEVGEVRGGAWRTYETMPLTKQGKEIQVNVSEEQVYSLLLLCEAHDAARWRKAVERAMNEPASLP